MGGDFSFNPLAQGEQEPLDPALDARCELVTTITNLPQAQAVDGIKGLHPHWDTETEFLDQVRLHLEQYGQIVATIRTTAASMASELAELRDQRAAVRSFLGINEGDK